MEHPPLTPHESGCPGLRECPLFELGHDGAWSRYGCVDDLAKPCRVRRGLKGWSFDAAWARAVRAIFAVAWARLDARRATIRA